MTLEQEIEKAIEKTYIGCFKVGIGLPNYEFEEGEHFTRVCSNVQAPFLNGILCSKGTPDFYKKSVPEVINSFRSKGLAAQWRFGPSTEHSEALEEILKENGAVTDAPHTIMYAPLQDHEFSIDDQPSLYLKRVTNEDEYKKWFQPFFQAFQLNEMLSDYFYKMFLNIGFEEGNVFPSYYLESEGKVVGCFSIFRTDAIACGVFNVAVCDEFRGKGFGKIVSNLAASKAKELGYSYAGQYASPEGERVYKKLGAIALSSYPFYNF